LAPRPCHHPAAYIRLALAQALQHPVDAPIYGLVDMPLPPRRLPMDIGCGILAPRSQTDTHKQHHNFGYTNTLGGQTTYLHLLAIGQPQFCPSWLLRCLVGTICLLRERSSSPRSRGRDMVSLHFGQSNGYSVLGGATCARLKPPLNVRASHGTRRASCLSVQI
jgi:hypothetical protein